MGDANVNNFVQFFQEFISMCLSKSWLDNNTQPETIRIAFERAQHIEESMRNLLQTDYVNEFLSLLCNDQHYTDLFLKNCLCDPPKYILKTIINSNADSNQVLLAFKTFQEVFTKERLTNSLSDLMVEVASKETLLRNMATVLPQHILLEFNSKLFLLKLIACDSIEHIVNMLKDCEQYTMDILVTCLLKDNQKFCNSVVKLKSAFMEVMSCKDSSVKKFWELFFNVDSTNLIQICLKDENICKKIFETLKDSCIEIMLNSNAESLNFTSQQLVSAIKNIYKNDTLKLDFSEYMKENDFDTGYLLLLFS